jgi:large subunit ribosomal protein L35
MPKMKNHRGAAKRVKRTGSGKFSRHHAYANHMMGHKTTKQKRNLRKSEIVSDGDQRRLNRLLPKRYS